MATGSTGVDARERLLDVHEIPIEERTLGSMLRKVWVRLQDLGYELWKSKAISGKDLTMLEWACSDDPPSM